MTSKTLSTVRMWRPVVAIVAALYAASALAQAETPNHLRIDNSSANAISDFPDAVSVNSENELGHQLPNLHVSLKPSVNMVSACGVGCYCITWISGSSAWVEVRCSESSGGTSGWSHNGGPTDGSDGTWTGDGRQIAAPGSLPGMPLTGTTSANFTNAKGVATTKLRGDLVETHIYEPNQCTELFANSPMGKSGIDVLATIIWRDGTGVADANGNVPCNNADAWTQMPADGRHARVVFLCPNNFNSGSKNRRAAIIIHEALHVAGQLEDATVTVGPGNPPTTGQITDNVKAACGL